MSERVQQLAGQLNYPKGMLAGQVAIITGSGQGIGAEAARLFANEGAKVIVPDIDSGKQWDNIIALHCTAPFQLVRAAVPYFRIRDGAPRSVISISSTSGIHGNPGQANYSVAKAGITGFTKTIAKEWGPAFGVRANTIAFGRIATRLTAAKEDGAFVEGPDGEKIALGIPQKQRHAAGDQAYVDIPLRRPGTATEAASSILAVASPLFSYVSGQTIMVTGGRNM